MFVASTGLKILPSQCMWRSVYSKTEAGIAPSTSGQAIHCHAAVQFTATWYEPRSTKWSACALRKIRYVQAQNEGSSLHVYVSPSQNKDNKFYYYYYSSQINKANSFLTRLKRSVRCSITVVIEFNP